MKINGEMCAGKCGKKKPANFNYCTACRSTLPPIDTICAQCGAAAHALFCDDCQAALKRAGESLIAQEKFNAAYAAVATNKEKRDLLKPRDPMYSGGQFPLGANEQMALEEHPKKKETSGR